MREVYLKGKRSGRKVGSGANATALGGWSRRREGGGKEPG